VEAATRQDLQAWPVGRTRVAAARTIGLPPGFEPERRRPRSGELILPYPPVESKRSVLSGVYYIRCLCRSRPFYPDRSRADGSGGCCPKLAQSRQDDTSVIRLTTSK
jgi:hypothetical protein